MNGHAQIVEPVALAWLPWLIDCKACLNECPAMNEWPCSDRGAGGAALVALADQLQGLPE
jgi:hypothetical protein